MQLTAAVALFSGSLDRVLLIRREEEPFKGLLGFPGGRVETGETVWEAARRELREETGLAVTRAALAGSFHADDVLMVVFAAMATDVGHADNAHWYEISALSKLPLAPNVADAVGAGQSAFGAAEALSLLPMASDAVRRLGELVTRSLTRSEANNGRTDVGWDHYLNRKRVGTVGTAMGLVSLTRCGIRVSPGDQQRVVETLLSRAHPGSGGWGVKSMEGAGSPAIVESTALVLQALKAAGCHIGSPEVQRGLSWLSAAQHPEGGWGATPRSVMRTLPTSLAIEALAAWDPRGFNESIARACSWLMKARNRDGGWGIRGARSGESSSVSTAPHTARVVSALLAGCHSPASTDVRSGTEWLLRTSGSWADATDIEYIGDDKSDRNRFEFKHAGHPLAVRALLAAGHPVDAPVLVAACTRLATDDAEDSDYGDSPIWRVHDRIAALSDFLGRTVEASSTHLQSSFRTCDESLTGIARFYTSQIENAVPADPLVRLEGVKRLLQWEARVATRAVQGVFLLGFGGMLSLIAPAIITRWDRYEPAVFISSFALTGVLAILAYRFDPFRWVEATQRFIEGWLMRAATGNAPSAAPAITGREALRLD